MRKRTSNRDKPSGRSETARVREEPPRSRWWLWFKRGFLSLCVIYLLVPFLLRPDILNHLVYSHRVRVPFFVDLSQPADLSLNHTVNLYLTSEEGVSLGVWHTVPEKQWREAQGKDSAWYQASLGDGSPIIIYLHGNGGTRAAPCHRVGLANVLSATGYHVLALDYRGFGDSSGEPTEAGLTTDALYLHQWVTARSGSSRVVIWGHSLGTGVATNTAVKLMEQGVVADGVIIEGAYTKWKEGAQHPFGWFYWRFPGFEYFFLDPMAENNIIFPNDENLKKMKSPLLILHSEDDHIVPIHMAQQLYAIAQDSETQVKMVPFAGSHGYLHNGLYKDPQLPNIIRQFMLSLTP